MSAVVRRRLHPTISPEPANTEEHAIQAKHRGIGDLAGGRSRVDYLAELGVDAIWLSPFYPSPLADGGYDITDHRDVDPRLGTLADFVALVADAHARQIKVIIDVVPNHTSDQHPWFTAALAA